MKEDRFTAQLHSLPVVHRTFVGLDSDGCVFNTMNIKQREHFHPLIIKHWHLEKCAEALRACAVFSNLTSRFRGSNRFPALLRTFELFCEYPGVKESGVVLPRLESLRAYVHSGLSLGNPSLQAEVDRTGDPDLASLLEWSLAINESIDNTMRPVPPFKNALRAFAMLQKESDVVVVSQTPVAALQREWRLHGLEQRVSLIAGQEYGTKASQLQIATQGKYHSDAVLMIGDGVGDLCAAQEAGCLFYPILPDDEETAWTLFCEEAYGRFLRGTYKGAYQDALVHAFEARLPAIPPWQTSK